MSELMRSAAWAAVIALDITGIGPFMVSQPLVCGPIFGWILGDLRCGIIIGGIVQLLWMDVTPVGVGIPFDATATTLLGVFWSQIDSHASVSHMVVALALAVPFGWLFRIADHNARKLNTFFIRKLDAVPDKHVMDALTLSIAVGLVWCWLRYAVFYLAAMALGQKVLALLWSSSYGPLVEDKLAYTLYVLPMAGMGVVLELFLSDEPERRFAKLRMGKGRKHA